MKHKITIFSKKEMKKFFNMKWGDKTDSNISSMYLTKKVDLSLNSLLSKFIELIQPKDVIADLGCGDGRVVLTLLKNKYKNIYAIDYSKEAINRLKNLIKTENIRIITRVKDLNKIILESNKFNAIICTNVLHYFSNSQILDFLKKIDLSLRPNGIIYLTFESELKLETINGREFKFENQPKRKTSDYKKLLEQTLLKQEYELEFSKTYKKTIYPTLPSFFANVLKTQDKRYIRRMNLYEVILRKT